MEHQFALDQGKERREGIVERMALHDHLHSHDREREDVVKKKAAECIDEELLVLLNDLKVNDGDCVVVRRQSVRKAK